MTADATDYCDIAVDTFTHDLILDDTGPILIGGDSRIRQQIKILLLTVLTEWFLDQAWGVPYFEEILIKAPRLPAVHSIMQERILSVPGALRLVYLRFSPQPATRILLVNFQCDTVYGRISDEIMSHIFRSGNG